MKYGLIGCSRISANHLKAALDNGFNIIALCDINYENIQGLLAQYGLEEDASIKRYADYREMLKCEPAIELVAITTPSNLHAPMALDCIEAKKHLILEKPLALSTKEASDIIEESTQAGVKVCVCHQNRFNRSVQRLRAAVEAGRFGKISHGSIQVRWNRNKAYYEQAPWRGSWAQDGGCLMNQCIHGIDLLLWMMDCPVTSVYAQTRRRFHDYIEAEDLGMAVLTFESGALATIEGTTNVYPKNLEESLCLFGETGTARIGGTTANTIEVWDFADANDTSKGTASLELAQNVRGKGHTLLYADMKEAIIQGRQPYINATAGRNALEVVLAIYQSQKTGLPVMLPLEHFSTFKMKGEFS